MSPRHRSIALALGLILITAQALAEKKVWVTVPHPPILGAALPGTKVIIGDITGRCSQEFAALLAQDMTQHGIALVDQAELDRLMPKFHLATGSIPQPGSSAGLASALGPAIVISAEIARCEAHPREPIIAGGVPAMHISRTEGHFQATLLVRYFASGETITTFALRVDPSKENKLQTGVPEPPSAPEVIELALAQAVSKAQQLYLPWTSKREASFYDDKECQLKEAYELFLKPDYPALLKAMQANAEACRTKPKASAAAMYDLGLAYMLVRDSERALSAFLESQKLRDNKAVSDAVEQAREDKESAAAAVRLILAEARQMQNEQPPPEVPAATLQTGILFSNELVLKLVLSHVAPEEIVKLIDSQPGRFSVKPEDLVPLKDAGASDAVIEAMRRKK